MDPAGTRPGAIRPDDHACGPLYGPPVVLYGDATCPRCQDATRFLRAAPVRLVWRHLVLRARGPRPRALAGALEAAARQDAFWPFLDRLLADPGRQDDPDLWALARELGLDVERFERDRRDEAATARIDADLADGLSAGASGTPAIVVAGGVDHGIPDEAWIQALLAERAT